MNFKRQPKISIQHGRCQDENRASCKACPALGLMQFVYICLEKSTSFFNTGEKLERKVRPQGHFTQNYPCS
jgi:hypothetical protein